MPLFLDVHNKIDNLTADGAADAHRKDLETQNKYGVKYLPRDEMVSSFNPQISDLDDFNSL